MGRLPQRKPTHFCMPKYATGLEEILRPCKYDNVRPQTFVTPSLLLWPHLYIKTAKDPFTKFLIN